MTATARVSAGTGALSSLAVLRRRGLARIETIVREINAWLLAVAIGLGTLDATVFVALKLPTIAVERVSAARDRNVDDFPPSARSPMGYWLE